MIGNKKGRVKINALPFLCFERSLSMKENEILNLLRVEGIMVQGYTLSPKIIMRDKRLTVEV